MVVRRAWPSDVTGRYQPDARETPLQAYELIRLGNHIVLGEEITQATIDQLVRAVGQDAPSRVATFLLPHDVKLAFAIISVDECPVIRAIRKERAKVLAATTETDSINVTHNYKTVFLLSRIYGFGH